MAQDFSALLEYAQETGVSTEDLSDLVREEKLKEAKNINQSLLWQVWYLFHALGPAEAWRLIEEYQAPAHTGTDGI